MPAYLVSIVNVRDPDGYQEYATAANQAAAKLGGKFLLRGRPLEVLKGVAPGNRMVVSEWESANHPNTRRRKRSGRVASPRSPSFCLKKRSWSLSSR